MENYQERENLRDQIRTFWKEGRTWTKVEFAVNDKLKKVHADIISAELLDDTKSMHRVVFSVCGWCERHGYFREKRFYAETLYLAIAYLEIAKKDPDWRIPTIIVKEIYFRKNTPAMTDFDGDISNLGFSDTQEVVSKNMCGTRSFRWKDLIKPTDNRYTY